MSKFRINVSEVIKIPFLYKELLPYKDKATEQLRHLYLKKVGKVVFLIVIIRLDNTQAVSKLVEFLVNLGPNYLKAVDYNIYYLMLNKYLAIEYKAENKNSKLITVINKIFTVATNALYKNNLDKRLSKKYIFKLFRGIIN